VGFWSDERRRWYVLAAAWVVLIVLGFTGFMAQTPKAWSDGSVFLDNLYRTLQLAVFQ
jgi:hypothetical protein